LFSKDIKTPLHLAVEEKNGGVVHLLIRFGADKTLKDKVGH
jgi:ankyrin repeat protein